VLIYDLNTGCEKRFDQVNDYKFSANSKNLLLEVNDIDKKSALRWITLPGGELHTIWSAGRPGEKPSNFTFDPTGEQLVFLTEEHDVNHKTFELWYADSRKKKAIMLVNNKTSGILPGMTLSNQTPVFTNDGRHIFLNLQASDRPKAKPNAVPVDVWSYRDHDLQSVQLNYARRDAVYSAVIDTDNRQLRILSSDGEYVEGHTNDFALIVREGLNEVFEANWNLPSQLSYYLVSLKDASRKLLKTNVSSYNNSLRLSPQGKWIIYYNSEQQNYNSYEPATGITRNITKQCHANWTNNDDEHPEPGLGWMKWIGNDEAVLISDGYDLWQIDPAGQESPVNLTNGYGLKNQIRFNTAESIYLLPADALRQGAKLLLNATNSINKDWGFFIKVIGKPGDPELLSMGPFTYGHWSGHENTIYSPPLKAGGRHVWLVERSGAADANNYFITTNFRSFKRITDVQPQKSWNWVTTELVHWKTPDGTVCDGILYKPENFNPGKKYPLLFNYYERRSDELNLYIQPGASGDNINIPSFVSRGYLVFVPDIHYKIGDPGRSASDAVVSAANYLVKMPWVDAAHMGIQGHSFGGYETNYIVTHSNIFAAACSASGLADLVSFYCSDERGGFEMYSAERNQLRMGATPWQTPDNYVNNSPIFKADKVSTPVLLMANKGDDVVYFAQGLEFFMALRRLGKKVWMLQYDDGGHEVYGRSADDYSKRMMQFFDYYLKGAPAPKWMIEGITARRKEIDDGLALEPADKNPGPGLEVNQ